MKVAFHDEITERRSVQNMTVLPRVGDDIVILGDWRLLVTSTARPRQLGLSVDIRPTRTCAWVDEIHTHQNIDVSIRDDYKRLQRRWDKADAAEKLKEEANKKLKKSSLRTCTRHTVTPTTTRRKAKTFWARLCAVVLQEQTMTPAEAKIDDARVSGCLFVGFI